MLRLLVVAALFFAGCRANPLVEAKTVLSVKPSSLAFPDTAMGTSAALEVELTNTGTVDRQVTATAGEPFSVTASLIDLPASSSAPLLIRFSPAAAGPFDGALRLESEGEVLEVQLTGLGVAPLVCPAPKAQCRVSTVGSSGCAEVNAPDGTACQSRCLEQASCVSGVCVGVARGCDDGDRCTVDACDPALGCTHTALSCADPADPCHVGQCDAVSGCVASPAPDGTPCGPNDCTSAKVCISGACLARQPPEGSRCGEPTPCQPAPVCQAGQCVAGPVTPLQPAWTVSVAGTSTLIFPGVFDASGNVYWVEQGAATTDLVSVDRGGAQRFRVTMAGQLARFFGYPVEDPSVLLVSEDRILVVMQDSANAADTRRAEVRSTLDGSLSWRAGRAELAPAVALAAGLPLWIVSVAAVPSSERVVLNLRTNAGGSAWSSWIASLDGATGAVQWTWRSTYLSATLVDEQGTVFTYEDLFVHSLSALSPTGLERWRVSQTNWSAIPSATHQGDLYTAYPSRVFSAGDGGVLSEPTFYWGRDPLVGFGHLVSDDGNSLCARAMFSVSLGSPAQIAGTWVASPAACVHDPMLTSRATVVVSSTGMNGTPPGRLYELSLDGGQLFSCPLPTAPGDHAALIDDGYVTGSGTSVSMYPLPGAKLAPHGWVAQSGGRARSRSPQP